jgi:hypothetical protein
MLGVVGDTGQLTASVVPAVEPKNTTCPLWARAIRPPVMAASKMIETNATAESNFFISFLLI